MVDLIQPTGFSIQFVLDKLNSTNGNNSKLNSKLPIGQLECFETKNISEGNAFMSKILRLILHWKDPSIDLPSSIIMKVPSPQHKKLQNMEEDESSNPMDDPELKWLCEFLVGAHRREINFYEHFSRLDPSLRLPKFYFGSDYHPSHRDGLILMEDLTPKGTTIPVLPGLNDAQVLEVLNEMAKIHSTSWRFPEWEKYISTHGGEDTFRDLIRGMDDGAKRLAEIDPKFGPLVDRVLPLFTVESCEFVIYSGSKFGFPASIVHADLYSPNILWLKDSQGNPTDQLCAIIDWQTTHSGNPCTDLCRLLVLNTPGEYRRANMPRLLEYYAKKVAQFMGGQAPFSMDQLRDAFKYAMPFAMMFLCYGLPFYYEMDSIVGNVEEKRKQNQRELLQRCRMFLEDTAREMAI